MKKGQCLAITKEGVRCPNSARHGSKYCGRHKYYKTPNWFLRNKKKILWGFSLILTTIISIVIADYYSEKGIKKVDIDKSLELNEEIRKEYYSQKMELIFRGEREIFNRRYNYGYIFMAIEEDEIYLKKEYGNNLRFIIDWDKTKFESTENSVRTTFPSIIDGVNNLQVTKNTAEVPRMDGAYTRVFSNMGAAGELVMLEMTGYGDIILIGIGNSENILPPNDGKFHIPIFK